MLSREQASTCIRSSYYAVDVGTVTYLVSTAVQPAEPRDAISSDRPGERKLDHIATTAKINLGLRQLSSGDPTITPPKTA